MPAPDSPGGSAITLSLISHTNVGKTTLARTLLREDVGDAHDQAHVTDANTCYDLIRLPGGEVLRLWDTPGFGDTARLVKRLKQSESPVGWILGQVWDRLADRPLWCSQQAVRNVREEADVVLYLVNAADQPEAAPYVAMEMEVLAWIGKPVILLLNQTGLAGDPRREEAEEARWREHLQPFPVVKAVLGLDAFARCWVQENELLRVVADVLPKAERPLAEKFDAAWRERNLGDFATSMDVLAGQLAASASDRVLVDKETLAQKLWIGRGRLKGELKRARATLSQRLAERTRAATNTLITLHGIEGSTAREFADVSHESFGEPKQVHESIWSALGGAAAGATGGLAADLAHGGMTFGGGAVLGGLGGGAGAYFLAKGLNLTRGKDQGVYWTLGHFRQQARLALLCYLAVAHFGRGRGAWQDGEPPEHWAAEVDAELAKADAVIEKTWKRSTEGAPADALREDLRQALEKAARAVLRRLYPGTGVF